MIVYAVLIAASRLVLLAHHPSDVVAGALIGVVGAMFVRYWFAARRLGFAIHRDGGIVPLRSVSGHLKRVARSAVGPIRSGRLNRRTARVRRRRANSKRRVLICLSPTQPRWPFPSLFPCATKPTTSAR